MSNPKRIVQNGVLNHCYQRTLDGSLLFYNVSDHLLLYTIMSVAAARHKVCVIKAVHMPEHLHLSAYAPDARSLSAFVGDYSSIFAREHNTICHRKGQLFDAPYGSALKKGDKAVRSNLIYLDNNAPERHLVARAEDYRWGFLAYGQSTHPFSERILLREASMPMRRAMERICYLHQNKRYISYRVLRTLFKSLPNDKEREQLTDYIISTYNYIDHAAAISFFGSYEQELIAAHASKGGEYDFKEPFNGKSDLCYEQMSSLVLQSRLFADIHDILSLSLEEKLNWFRYFKHKTSAYDKQIAAFLHLPSDLVLSAWR